MQRPGATHDTSCCLCAHLIVLVHALQVRQQVFHDRLRVEQDIVEGVDVEGAAAFTEVCALATSRCLPSFMAAVVCISVCWEGRTFGGHVFVRAGR